MSVLYEDPSGCHEEGLWLGDWGGWVEIWVGPGGGGAVGMGRR